MKLTKLLLTVTVAGAAHVAMADVPTDSLLIARAATLALVDDRGVPAFYYPDEQNVRKLGTSGKVAFEMLTGVTPGGGVSKNEAKRYVRINNPCEKASDYNARGEYYTYDCSLRARFWDEAPGGNGKFNDEKLSYKVRVYNEEGSYSAVLLSDKTVWTVTKSSQEIQ